MPSRQRQNPLGIYIPALVLGLAVLNLAVTSLSILVDFVTLWKVQGHSRDVASHSWNASAISGMILLALHISIIIVQIWYGTKLFGAVRERDYVKCRNWFYVSINMYCMEFIIFIFISFLASNVEAFIVFTTLALIYKFVQLWPVDGFIENLQSYSEPLLGEAAEFHI